MNNKYELISLKEANDMSMTKIETQLGICRRRIVDDTGLSESDANTLMTNIMRLSWAYQNKKQS